MLGAACVYGPRKEHWPVGERGAQRVRHAQRQRNTGKVHASERDTSPCRATACANAEAGPCRVEEQGRPKENRDWDLLGVNGQEDDDDQAIRQIVLVLVGLDDLDGTAGRHALEAWAWSVVWSKEKAT